MKSYSCYVKQERLNRRVPFPISCISPETARPALQCRTPWPIKTSFFPGLTFSQWKIVLYISALPILSLSRIGQIFATFVRWMFTAVQNLSIEMLALGATKMNTKISSGTHRSTWLEIRFSVELWASSTVLSSMHFVFKTEINEYQSKWADNLTLDKGADSTNVSRFGKTFCSLSLVHGAFSTYHCKLSISSTTRWQK